MNTPRPTPTSARCRATRGFTLVELMIVLAVAAILLGTAVPAFTGLIRSSALASATNDLFAAFLVARSEAVKRNARVAVCKSANGAACAQSGGWEQGWIVFHDANNNGARDPDERLVWHAQPMSADMRLSGNLTVAKYVSYSPTGETKFAGGGFQAGTITLCHAAVKGGEARQIIIASGGRPRVQKTRVQKCGG